MHSNVAKETVVDVSKFLKFSAAKCGSSDVLDPRHLYDEVAIHGYLTQLQGDGVQAVGQLTKLSCIQTALSFAVRHFNWRHQQDTKASVDDILDTLSEWKKSLQKQKASTAKSQLPSLSERIENLGDYASLFDNQELRQRVRGPGPKGPQSSTA